MHERQYTRIDTIRKVLDEKIVKRIVIVMLMVSGVALIINSI